MVSIRKYASVGARFTTQLVILVFFVFPLFWILSASFKRPIDAITLPPIWFFKPTLTNYQSIFIRVHFAHFLRNSLIIASIVTIVSLLLGYPVAYGLARYRFRGRRNLGFWLLSLYMFPPLAVVLPYLLILKSLKLTDTHIGLSLAHLSFILPLVIWLLQRFIRDIPVEFEEAAAIDGAGLLHRLLWVVLPLAAPGITATGIFAFMMSWNEFAFALILAPMRAKTLPVASQGLASWAYINWGEISAACVLITVPALILVIIVRDYLVRGFSLGLK